MGFIIKKVWDLPEIKNIYDDIKIIKNEDDISKLGFNSIDIAEKFVIKASELWLLWISSENIITMYFFAEIIKRIYKEKYITKKDLYELSEKEIMAVIKNCPDNKIKYSFDKFMKCNNFIDSEEFLKDKFCVSRKVKRRYINPITTDGRIYDVSSEAKEKIDNYLNMKISKYAYADM